MEDVRSKVLSIVQMNGPILPVKISKVINQNILFTSAILSELIDKKQILLSKAKVGGSPIYYIKGQEERLQMLYDYLENALKKTYNILKEKKVLKDSECEPWQRVALRELKDFAVQIDNNNEIFWRWYLTKEEEAKKFIEDLAPKKIDKPILEEKPKKELVKEQPKIEKPKIKRTRTKSNPEILNKIQNYFNQNKIKIIKEDIIKKNKEFNYSLEVDSVIGKVTFFCKIKIKKRVSDGDLSLAMNEAKGKQSLFLSEGDLTKKAKEFLEKEKETIIFKKL
ncbi:MAG: hypothetical protein QGF74_01060 [Candidatus Nanoarchaeia archaeon]|jgi:hypothetical protein|nr:hypothetical protein [Candidatus Nanoarchaeia archaeon]|tara:strand:+ start:368 stop:1207 length:840 start_codon:yes stop_codon:yes gene_type:complete